jgi:hypothetical protein
VTSTTPEPDGILRVDRGAGLLVGYFATPPAGSGSAAYAMAYHPSARSLEAATPISLDFGDARQGVDVQLTLSPTVRVSGRVVGPAETLAKLPIRLVPVGAEGLALGAEAAITAAGADGTFTFLQVPSGAYTLIASRSTSELNLGGSSSSTVLMPRSAISISSMSAGQVPGANGVSFATRSTTGAAVSGRFALSVGDRDVTDLEVALVSGVTVSGHFLWDGAEAQPANMVLNPFVRLEPADGDLSRGLRSRLNMRRPDEAAPVPVPFSVDGVLPGRYLFGSIASGSFSVEAIEWRGRDILAIPLEVESDKDVTGIVIRMSSKPTTITGSVRDASGGPATSGAVLAFPASPALWRNFGLSALLFKTGTIVGNGTYRLDRLVPGDYLLAAVPDEDRAKWVDPDYLASIATSATRVRVTPGSSPTQDLRLIGGGQ